MEFPVIMPTDDALITYLRIFDSRGMTKELLRKVIQVQTFTQAHGSSGNLLVFCLHPLRIGQAKYIGVLEKLLEGIDHIHDFELVSFSERHSKMNGRGYHESSW